jgi:hypothetical protein
MNAGALLSAMPTNVLESVRAIVIAGFPNEIETVNQYAAPIEAGHAPRRVP